VQIKITNQKGKKFDAVIRYADAEDLNSLHDWKFDWSALYTDDSIFFKLSYNSQIQGIIKLEEENDQYYVLKNIEVAPSNYGSKGKYKGIAEALISFACLKSFELNEGGYRGFLVFTTKGVLIDYYQKKYGAELIYRDRMLINPEKGKELILNYLKIDLTNEK